MAVTAKIHLQDPRINISGFRRQDIEKASMRAINETMAQVKTQAIREITSKYNLTAGEVRLGLFVLKASTANLTSKLRSSVSTFPMTKFNPSQVTASSTGNARFRQSVDRRGNFRVGRTRDTVVGTTVEIIKGQKLTMRDAFIFLNESSRASVKAFGSYDTGSFQWDDDKQGRPTKLKSMSVHGALNNIDVQRKLQEKASEIYMRTYYARLKNIVR
jgi:hypothetical protein